MLTPDDALSGQATRWAPEPLGAIFADANYCGQAFNNGLFRFHNAESGPLAGEIVHRVLGASLPPGIAFFAVDWTGTHYGAAVVGDDSPTLVYTADVSHGTVTQFGTLSEFIGFLNSPTAAVSLDQADYLAWITDTGSHPVDFTSCVGYRRPPFLGGSDSVDNRERSSIADYWIATGDLLADRQLVGRVLSSRPGERSELG